MNLDEGSDKYDNVSFLSGVTDVRVRAVTSLNNIGFAETHIIPVYNDVTRCTSEYSDYVLGLMTVETDFDGPTKEIILSSEYHHQRLWYTPAPIRRE
jgi:hypothetical protein